MNDLPCSCTHGPEGGPDFEPDLDCPIHGSIVACEHCGSPLRCAGTLTEDCARCAHPTTGHAEPEAPVFQSLAQSAIAGTLCPIMSGAAVVPRLVVNPETGAPVAPPQVERVDTISGYVPCHRSCALYDHEYRACAHLVTALAATGRLPQPKGGTTPWGTALCSYCDEPAVVVSGVVGRGKDERTALCETCEAQRDPTRTDVAVPIDCACGGNRGFRAAGGSIGYHPPIRCGTCGRGCSPAFPPRKS